MSATADFIDFVFYAAARPLQPCRRGVIDVVSIHGYHYSRVPLDDGRRGRISR